MALLQGLQLLLMVLDGRLQLFYIFSSPLPKCRLSLSVPLLSLFRRRVYLDSRQRPFVSISIEINTHRFPATLALLDLSRFLRKARVVGLVGGLVELLLFRVLDLGHGWDVLKAGHDLSGDYAAGR